MPVGLPIPKKITEIVKRDKYLLNLAIRAYKPYFRLYVLFHTWRTINRENEANVDPFGLLYIKPENIERYLVEEYQNFEKDYIKPRIRSGNWDLQTEEFRSKDIYKSIKMRFEDNKDWKETPKFINGLKAIENNNKDYYKYCAETEEELLESLSRIDSLYKSISEEGYKTQNEAANELKTDQKFNIDEYLPNVKEILVSIGRDGDIILEDGNHRLSIAKILELEKIPVRVLVRHKKWQEKRNQALKKPETLNKELREHSDIRDMLN